MGLVPACRCAYVLVCALMWVPVEVRGLLRISSSTASLPHCIFCDGACHRSWGSSVGSIEQQTFRSTFLSPPYRVAGVCHTSSFYVGAGDLNSYLHVCETNTSPLSHLPSSKLISKILTFKENRWPLLQNSSGKKYVNKTCCFL